MTEECITEFLEENEGRATKKLSQDFSRTESRILAATFKLGDSLLNQQVRTFSGTVPGTSQNKDRENREPTGGRSQINPNPKVEFCIRRTSNSAVSD